MQQPTVAHYVDTFLWTHGTWIYPQVSLLRKYRPIVMCLESQNLDVFPFDPIYAYRNNVPKPIRYWDRLSRKLFPGKPYPEYFWNPLKREKASLIHAHFGNNAVAILEFSRRLQVPLVTAFYGYDVSSLVRDVYWVQKYRQLFQNGTAFLAEGCFMKETLAKLGCPSEKIYVQHLGVDLSKLHYKPREISTDGQVTILVAASFKEKKGIAYALKAFAQVINQYPNIHLRIVGDGPLRPELERLIGDLEISSKVKMLGEQPFTVFCEELESAHIFLSPSITASDGDTEGGCPVAIIEAQATGLPVVSTFHADIPEAVIHGETGLLAPERDVGTLAKHLGNFVARPEEWSRWGKLGREHIERDYDVVTQIRKLEEIYDAIVSKYY